MICDRGGGDGEKEASWGALKNMTAGVMRGQNV